MAVNLPAPPADAPARPSEVRVLARGLAILRAFGELAGAEAAV